MPQQQPASTLANPAPRDNFADLLRTVALGAVILGHWVMAAIWHEDGALRIDNVLNHAPQLWPLTWVFVLVPLFFLVGGFTNANSWRRAIGQKDGPDAAATPTQTKTHGAYRRFLARRCAGLLPPLLPFLLLVGAAAGVALALGARPALVRGIVIVVVMPLWFIIVYLALAAAVPPMYKLHQKYGLAVWLWLAAGAALFDALRFITGKSWVAAPNYFFVWGLAQQIGFAYADGTVQRWGRRVHLALAGVALAVLGIAVTWGAWPPSMIGLSGERSNFAPPALPALLLMLAQIFAFLAFRPALSRWLDRPRVARRLPLASNYAMPAFLWHLPVLVMVTGIALLVRMPLPTPASVSWWLTRPVVWTVLAAALCGWLWVLTRLRARRRQTRDLNA